jgi:hypothetical protein
VVSSSSTKKAAKLAKKGKGKKVRFQGGTLFPMVILGILVFGLATIVYARASQPEADASPPTVRDHWHIAYGFSLCDQPEFFKLNGALEEADSSGVPLSTDYLRTGVHSHDDGVIHWHASTSAAVGSNATLGLFLENYGVELDDDSLKFPDSQGGKEYVEGETECPDGEDGELTVTVWDSPEDTSNGTRYVSDFDDIRIDKNSLVITVAFQPSGTDIEMPPWAAQLEELGAVDMGSEPTDSVPDASVPATSAVAGTTTVAGEPSADEAPTTTSGETSTTAGATTTTSG